MPDDGIVLMLAAEMIRRHEGLRLRAYDDATGLDIVTGSVVRGRPTIGIGRNLADPGISEAEAEILFAADLERAVRTAREWLGEDAWAALPAPIAAAVADMAFNLGFRIRSFALLREALRARDWEASAREALDSRWARQVGSRATEIAGIIRSGGGTVAHATGTGAAIVREG